MIIIITKYFVLVKTIERNMTIVQKIVNNLINTNIFPLRGQLIKTGWVIFGDNQFMSKHTFHRINTSTYLFQFDYFLYNFHVAFFFIDFLLYY